ncbi:MAG: GDP-mannose 4,6-dehydratase, partial [Candidatus Gracilibacteria bacterium]|nr:GDP-mannose 4,6-dehydratase [Candidatus Gracilibacteria bacterium]
NYREGYGLFACNGILFNHESPRRGETFLTRKVTRALANILSGNQKKLYLGNIDSKRDWGFAPEYVEMMWLMLQQDKPDDYVVGTGESHSVREMVEVAFAYAGIDLAWRGEGASETAVVSSLKEGVNTCLKPGDVVVEIDPRYFRPTEVNHLQADISKARQALNWQPRITFADLTKTMVDYDLKMAGIAPPGEGIETCRSRGFFYTDHTYSFSEKVREGGGRGRWKGSSNHGKMNGFYL